MSEAIRVSIIQGFVRVITRAFYRNVQRSRFTNRP